MTAGDLRAAGAPWVLAALIGTVMAVAALLFTSGRQGDTVRARPLAGGLLALPLTARGPVSAVLGASQVGYEVRGMSASNPAQGLSLGFSRSGVAVSSGGGRADLSLVGFGRIGAMNTVARVMPTVRRNRVTFARPGLTEWYANGPVGLEQGFTVQTRPSGARGPVVLSLSIAGNLRPRRAGGAAVLSGAGALLRYGGLAAVDARGRALRAWLGAQRHGLLLRVDDRGAVYPVRIDPFIQQGEKLVGTGAAGPGAGQGVSVALSADGNTALVGGPADNTTVGAAWVFTRSGGVWSQQGPKLAAAGVTGTALQGFSVALSADGNTALIGTVGDGAAVFTRAGGVWSQQGAMLVGTGAVGSAAQGTIVALSGDGNTALISGPLDNSDAGAAWVFTRSGGVWSQQGSKLVGTGAVGAAQQGTVALSYDGNTALVGGPLDNSDAGAVWVFTRSGGVWSQQGSKLVGTGAVGPAYQAQAVRLSADGNTALVSGGYDNSDAGAAWVFTRSGGVWSQQGNKLVGTGAVGAAAQSLNAIALSGDGNTALIGGPQDNNLTGAAWVFTRSGGVWTQQGAKLVGTGAVGPAGQGFSVALSGDAGTALIGGPADNNQTGAVWVFTTSGTLSVTFAGAGGGTVSDGVALSCTASCTHDYSPGSMVTLTATAAAGSAFAGWSGPAGCSGTGTCAVTINATENVTATFNTTAPVTQILSVMKSGTGTGSVTSAPAGISCGTTCSASYAQGAVVTLSASAAPGSTFVGWSGGGCSGAGTCTVTMSAAQHVAATFTAVIVAERLYCGMQHRGKCLGIEVKARFAAAGNASWYFDVYNPTSGHGARDAKVLSIALGKVTKHLRKPGTVAFLFRLPRKAVARAVRLHLGTVSVRTTFTTASGRRATLTRSLKIRLK